MRYVSLADRWALVLAVAFIVIGVVLWTLPLHVLHFTTAPNVGLFIGCLGLGVATRTSLKALLARRRAQATNERDL